MEGVGVGGIAADRFGREVVLVSVSLGAESRPVRRGAGALRALVQGECRARAKGCCIEEGN